MSDLEMAEATYGPAKVNQDFYQDFFGFPSEEWVHNNYMNSPEKLVSSRGPVPDDNDRKPETKVEESNPIFRSSSGSFKYMRFKIASRTGTWRSNSLSVMEKSRMTSKSKSRWQVFMYGFGSGKFPAKMDLSDIKSRQLRQQSTTTVSRSVDHVVEEESSDQRSRKKVWWRFVDVLGCGS
ncbi:hypothetical protein L1887_09324 [Cichorium endivia]|nr:hypothetical protein L1887_09324 [Cichorium endivia]